MLDSVSGAFFIRDNVSIANFSVARAEIANHLDNCAVISIGISSIHDDIRKTRDMHSHGPHFSFSTNDPSESETDGITGRLFGHL